MDFDPTLVWHHNDRKGMISDIMSPLCVASNILLDTMVHQQRSSEYHWTEGVFVKGRGGVGERGGELEEGQESLVKVRTSRTQRKVRY